MPIKPHVKPVYHELLVLEVVERTSLTSPARSEFPLKSFRAHTPLAYDTLGRVLKRLVDARALSVREIPVESKTGGRTRFEKRWSVGPAFLAYLHEVRSHPGLQGDRKFEKNA